MGASITEQDAFNLPFCQSAAGNGQSHYIYLPQSLTVIFVSEEQNIHMFLLILAPFCPFSFCILTPIPPHFLSQTAHFCSEVLDHLQAELECLPNVPLAVNDNKQYPVMPQKLLAFLFEGTLSSRVVCGECGHVSTKEEPFQDLSLDFPSQWVDQEWVCMSGEAHEGCGR